MMGRVIQILTPTAGQEGPNLVILEKFEVAGDRHPVWRMLYLYRRDEERTHFIVKTSVRNTCNTID